MTELAAKTKEQLINIILKERVEYHRILNNYFNLRHSLSNHFNQIDRELNSTYNNDYRRLNELFGINGNDPIHI